MSEDADRKLVAEIEAAKEQLNTLLNRACDAGLCFKLDTQDVTMMCDTVPRMRVEIWDFHRKIWL